MRSLSDRIEEVEALVLKLFAFDKVSLDFRIVLKQTLHFLHKPLRGAVLTHVCQVSCVELVVGQLDERLHVIVFVDVLRHVDVLDRGVSSCMLLLSFLLLSRLA